MSAAINSTPMFARKSMPRPAVEASRIQPKTSETDADASRLSAAVARGDEAAFREFYDRYHRRLFRFALVLSCGDEMLAHDAVQSAFVTAAAKLRVVESEKHLWNWLARVARQQFARSWRRQQRDLSVVSLADLPDYVGTVESDSLLEESLDAALLAIDSEERQIVEWFYFDHLSHKKIADPAGCHAQIRFQPLGTGARQIAFIDCPKFVP